MRAGIRVLVVVRGKGLFRTDTSNCLLVQIYSLTILDVDDSGRVAGVVLLPLLERVG